MKRISILAITVFVTLLTNIVSAYDIEVDGIYYNIDIENKTVSVTFQGGWLNCYEGNIIIPSVVSYANQELPVTSIDNFAFSDCTGLTSVRIPNSVTSIGDYAFRKCTGLTSISIPSSVTTIGEYAFRECTGLTSITIPNSVTSIGDAAFRECTRLTSITIPNSVTSIGGSTFSNCSGLTSITIPSSVTSIGEYAFRECTGLTSVTIPNSVTSIGYSAFLNCNNLNKIEISDLGSWCQIQFENYFSNPLYFAHHLYLGDKEINNLVIPESVSLINSYAFIECYSLESLEIPNTVNYIGEDAFSECSNLTKLILDNGGNSLNINTPFGSSLEELYIGRNTTGWTFNGGKLKILSIGFLVSYIDVNFAGNENLTNINCYNNTPPALYVLFANTLYVSVIVKVPTGSLEAYKNADIWKNFWNIEESSELISIFVIDELTYLITGNNEVTLYNQNLSLPTELYLKNQVEYNGISYNVVSISNDAFKNCFNLTKISIPSNILSIGNDVFSNCLNLNSIIFESSTSNIYIGYNTKFNQGTTITPFPNPTTVDEKRTGFRKCFYDGLFYGLPIEELVINRNIELPIYFERKIGNKTVDYETVYNEIIYYPPFYGLNNLKTVEIGENVTSICRNTIDVVINNAPTVMNYTNFGQCDNIQTVISKNPVAPIGGGFTQYTYENATLYLPNGGKVSYQSDEYWKNFIHIIEDGIIPLESIKFEYDELTIFVGETKSLNLIFNPENATYSEISWESSNESVLKISESGLITAVSPGSSLVTATIDNLSAWCTVIVKYPFIEAEQIVLNIDYAEINVGENIQLEASVLPEETTDKTITWSSSNENVATVSNNGLVTAISLGTVLIKATCGKASSICTITVRQDAGIESLFENPVTKISVYSPQGILIKKDCKVEELKSLTKGIYIIVSGKERYKISI